MEQQDGWNQPCSEDHFLHVSKHIAEWTEIAPYLEVTPTDVASIRQHDSTSLSAQTLGMLRKWRQKHGTEATYKRLADAFRKCERQDLVEKICELIAGTQNLQQVTHTSGEHDPIVVFVKPAVSEGVRSLLKEYSKMIMVLKKVELSDEKFVNLRSFLAEYCDEDSFENCPTLKLVVQELKNKSKICIFNIHTLIECCEFLSSQAVTSVQKYEELLDTFLTSTFVEDFECSLHNIRRDVEKITLKLDDNTSKDTLRNLKNLVAHFFGDTSNALILHKIHRGCVCVTWLVPMSLVPTLKAKAEQLSPEYLASKGVLELVIGLRIAPNEAILSGHNTTLFGASKSEIQFAENVTRGIEPAASGAPPIAKPQLSVVLPQVPLTPSRATLVASRTPLLQQLQSVDSQISRSALSIQPQRQPVVIPRAPAQPQRQPVVIPRAPAQPQRQPVVIPPSDIKQVAALKLTKENYMMKFTALLHLEEVAHEQLLKLKCNGKYQLHVKPKDRAPGSLRHRMIEHARYAFMQGMSGDQIMYAAQASECVYICDPSNGGRVAKADIPSGGNFNKLSDKLFLGFTHSEASNLESYFRMQDGWERHSVYAQFEVKHSYFDMLRRSLANLSNEAIQRIMPLVDEFTDAINFAHIPKSTYDTMELDEYQFRALRLIMSCQSQDPVIIPGPFGTGKTRVLAVAAYSFIENAKSSDSVARILVCCHHQVSADTYVEKYFGDMLTHKFRPWDGVELVRLTRKVYYLDGDVDYKKFYVPIDKFRQQVQYGLYNAKRIIVVTTFSTALNIGSLFGADFFTHILLDEGAQVREPEAVAPLCMANEDTKIIIAGDPHQVGPALLVLGDMPQQLGLGVSLLERLLNVYGENLANFITHLSINHRCHKDILELPSNLFYGSSLIPMSPAGTVSDAPYPLLFVCSSTADPCPIVEDTSENEAKLLVEHFRQLSRKGDTRTFQRNTCFMALSRRQITVLKSCLTKEESSQVKLIPSYEIQGREFKALFISTVECVQKGFQSANPTKSFCNRYVFNTALTRAQSLVVCAGNPFQLLKVEAAMVDPVGCWREYLRNCIEQETFIVPTGVGNRNKVIRRLRRLLGKDEPHVQLKLDEPKKLLSQKYPMEAEVQLKLPVKFGESELPDPQVLSETKKKKRPKKKQAEQPYLLTSFLSDAATPRTHPVFEFSEAARQKKPDKLDESELPDPQASGEKKKRKKPKKKKKQAEQPYLLTSFLSAIPHTHHEYEFSSPSEPSSQPSSQQKVGQASTVLPSHSDDEEVSQTVKIHDHVHQLRNEKLLKAELTVGNYKKKFHQLLCREEDEHERLLIEKCSINEYTLTMEAEQTEDEEFHHGYISADHLDGDKIAYIEQACEREGNLVITYNRKDYRAAMVMSPSHYKERTISICMPKQAARQLYSPQPICVEVKFELKYSYFNRLHKAIDLLSIETLNRLLPTNASFFPKLRTVDSNLPLAKMYHKYFTLEYGQREALKMIVYAEPKAPVIVAGSFGTGKTRIIAQAAFQILTMNRFRHQPHQRPRVLVCAHHQASANSFLAKYFGQMKEEDNLRGIRIARMIEFKRINDVKRKYQKYCMTINQVTEELTKIQLVISTFGITLHLAEKLKQNGQLDRDWFTHILIDEGAQTREPETIAPLSLCGPKTVIAIVGDHRQVGPASLVLGSDPQQYGLNQSLHERLHTLYDCQQPSTIENHRASLIINYRCHRSLLALPSYLFYNSALITNNIAEKQALLHPDTTFSLQFICSSLDKDIVEVTESTNEEEADLLLNAAAEYVKNWPLEWGKKDLSKVCLMATTANQQNAMRNALRPNKIKSNLRWLVDVNRTTVDIRKAYDMQGLEFQCVFLSTAEPTTAEGESKNPTKTPCNQYVFNTAITRAQSLVVCVGNPFLLMKIEKKVGNGSCWSEYIKRCMENKTFEIPSCLWTDEMDRQDKMSLLTKLIYRSGGHKTTSLSTKTVDSITKAYNTVFERLPSMEHCRLQLKSVTDGSLCWVLDDTETPPDSVQQQVISHVSNLKGTLKCYLEIVDRNKALGHPLDLTKSVILNGLKNWKGALNDDLVEVELYETSKDVRYGKVVKVLKTYHQERYVCQMDRHKTIFFDPIDKKTPRFVNLPKLSRDLMNLRKKDIEEGLTSQHQWVVIFEEDSLPHVEGNKLPKIKEIITAESARNLLFVVRVIGWEPDHLLPLGAVVESLPLGTNFFHAERILKVTHDIHTDDLDEEPTKELKENVIEPLPPDVSRQVFTIDPSDATILDDALSLVHESGNQYTMAVLISNVAGQLEQGSPSDKRAQSRATSIYGAFSRDMLPAALCQKLSLSPKKLRDVIIVSTKVTLRKDSLEITGTEIKKGKIESQVQLDYLEAQSLLSRESPSDSLQKKLVKYLSCCSPGQPDLSKSLQVLYEVAMHLRVKRLKQAAHAYSVSDDESMKSWQAHLLVEELMIWANRTVAEHVHKHHLASGTVLLRQSSPDEQELRKIDGNILEHSVALSKLVRESPKQTPQLLVPNYTFLELQNALKSGNMLKLQCLLTSDRLYPQLATAISQLAKVSKKAEYVSSKVLTTESSKPFRHQDLHCDYYTHFTSPIRRYCDVIMQRLLLSIVKKEKCCYSAEKLTELCKDLNILSRRVKQFVKDVKQVEFAQQFQESSVELCAFVNRNKNIFEVSFPDVKYSSCLKRKNSTFHISALVCLDRDEILKWRVFMFFFNGNDTILHNPHQVHVPGKRSDTEVSMTVLYPPGDETALEMPDPYLKRKYKGTKEQVENKLFQFQLSLMPKQEAIPVNGRKWQSVIKNVGHLSTVQPQLADLLEDQPQTNDFQPSITTINRFKKSPIVKYEVTSKLGSNSIVRVWLGQTFRREPILSSSLQLMEVAPELQICLQHNEHPAECFSDTEFCQASKATYTSLNEYVSLWEKVLLAEVAQDSVLSRENRFIILKEVPLQWPTLKIPDKSTGDYYLPQDPITLTIPPESRTFIQYNMLINPGDLVCVRYDIKMEQCKAVYHLVVKKVYTKGHKTVCEDENEKLPLIIEMEHIGRYSCLVSPKMATILTKPPTCELQVINIQNSYSRVYKGLMSLKQDELTNQLVHLIALGDMQELINPMKDKALQVLKEDKLAHKLWTHDIRLNSGQIEAIKQAVTNCFQLIQGPPGTGKSEIGAHIAYIFGQLNRDSDQQCVVVYCAPSNKAVDVIHDKLLKGNERIKHSKGKELKLLRLYGKAHERSDFKGPYTSDGYLKSYEEEKVCQDRFKPHALHYLLRKDCAELEEMEEQFKKMKKEDVPTPKFVMKYNKLIKRREKYLILQDYDVILTTCNECAGKRLSYLKDMARIAQVIIDECGMAHEPETIAAVGLSNHVVLIGDHKQLQPVIKYRPARDHGLGTSLFQRYAEKCEECPLVTLEVQYRMHENICKFPSKHFYDDILRAHDSVNKRPPVAALRDFWPAGPRWPILFLDVVEDEMEFLSSSEEGTEVDEIAIKEKKLEIISGKKSSEKLRRERKTDSHSKFNQGQAKNAVELAEILRTKLPNPDATIAIITPYRAQKVWVACEIPKSLKTEVLTINECQGDEYDYAILTTVRSLPLKEIEDHRLVEANRHWKCENLGFLADDHLINVAITRARQGLIIIGNSTLLKYDTETWRPLIKLYEERDCLVDGNKFIRRHTAL